MDKAWNWLVTVAAISILMGAGAIGLLIFAEEEDRQKHEPAAPIVSVQEERRMSQYEYRVINYEVIDGDTVRCMLDLGFDIYKQIDVRIGDVNTPEKRGHEKTAGIPVTDAVKRWFQTHDEGDVYVISASWGKYAGRCVGEVRIGGFLTLSEFLREYELCQDYGADDFTDEELAAIQARANDYVEGVGD